MTARKAQSWEDFKREAFGGRTETIGGVTVRVPTDMPLVLEDLAGNLSAESRAEDFDEVVTLLYGDGVFQQWVAAGMGAAELMTALMWGMVQATGRDITFMEAYDLVMSDDPGKALAMPANRAARRAASKKPSASTGGPSKRTSSASTASARTRSRA
ncbi:hypothetical protein EAO71_24235 [Streptomyces sp. ms191]|uniref:hypothetical protein n=1 Tax=Streptomyces sp. ms191 TaxID=1827978 RepID=UPI0011CEC035|nr:hypothetical protein [Streptomyces sp. ms191]TXS22614.1 hypothetical protein EAO71_24235 [Streptomyces sp. ms191]